MHVSETLNVTLHTQLIVTQVKSSESGKTSQTFQSETSRYCMHVHISKWATLQTLYQTYSTSV